MTSSHSREEVIIALIILIISLMIFCLLIILNDGYFFARNPWGIGINFSEEFEEAERRAGKYFAPRTLWELSLFLFAVIVYEDFHRLITIVGYIGFLVVLFIPVYIQLRDKS